MHRGAPCRCSGDFVEHGLRVALVNRYVWDFYFEKKRETTIPHFLREVVGGIIFLIVLLSS